ncbi:MAG TPA: ribonuclease R, partial [Bacteroidales bacterium]|nr:ribonuclease R [Bacteroidales bacterium]
MVKKEKNKKKEGFNKKMLIKSIMSIFTSNSSQSLNYRQLSKDLGAKDPTSKRLINEVLYELADQGVLKEVYRGKFTLSMVLPEVEGIVEMERDGSAHVVTDDNQEISVSEHNLNHALHGDRVKVALVPKHRKKRAEAEVVEVISRAKRTFVGRIEMERNYAFVITDTKFMPYDIFIPKDAMGKAKDGQKVIAQITDWPMHTKNPVGEIIEVIGYPGVHEVEMHAILAEFELPYRFPEELDRHAEKISEKITQNDYSERRDFRGVPTFTIDPAD